MDNHVRQFYYPAIRVMYGLILIIVIRVYIEHAGISSSWSGIVSVVGIATRYGLDGPGIEFRRERYFRTGPAAHPASYTMGTGSFPGGKAAGTWC